MIKILYTLGFHDWGYITDSGLDPNVFRGCLRCGKWQSKSTTSTLKSDREFRSPSKNIRGGYTTWDEMKAAVERFNKARG